MAVLLADRCAGLQAVAEELLQNADGGLDTGFVTRQRCRLNHVLPLPWDIC